MAGYELITTAPCPRTAVFRGRDNRLAGTTDDGKPPRPARLRRRRNRWRVRRRISLGTCLAGKGARLVHVPAAVRVVQIGLPERAGTRSGSIRSARRGNGHPIRTAAQGVRRRGQLVPRPCRLNRPIAACRWRRGQLLGTTGQQRTGPGQHRVVQIQLNADLANGRRRPRKPDSGHVRTVSVTVRLRRARWNAMKPRIQCVVNPRFHCVRQASGSRPIIRAGVLRGRRAEGGTGRKGWVLAAGANAGR